MIGRDRAARCRSPDIADPSLDSQREIGTADATGQDHLRGKDPDVLMMSCSRCERAGLIRSTC
jgi:hypothetical protein